MQMMIAICLAYRFSSIDVYVMMVWDGRSRMRISMRVSFKCRQRRRLA